MTTKKIDRLPPVPTGNVKTDIEKINEYLIYLRENINFAINSIDKKESEGNK